MPQNNHDEQIGQLDQRMTRVETMLEGIGVQLGEVTRGFKSIQTQQAESLRPNYQLLIGLGSFVVVVGGGLWAIAIRPIEQSMAALGAKMADVGSLEKEQIRLGERSEVLRVRMEAAEALNLKDQQMAWIFTQLLWRKSMGDDLPSKDVWPSITRPGEMSVGGSSRESFPDVQCSSSPAANPIKLTDGTVELVLEAVPAS